MKHIFFALGQNHVNNFESLLKNNVVKGEEYVLITGAGTTVSPKLWTRTIISTISFNNNAASKYSQLQTMFLKVREYASIVKNLDTYKDQPCVIYLAYIEDVLSNYLFFNFNSKAKIVVVEDGTLNYYNHTITNVNGIKFKLKKIIASIYGLKFQKYIGHSSGAEYPKVIAQYLTFPNEAFITNKAMQLPVLNVNIDEPVNDLYIIGQESFGAIMGNDNFLMELSNYFSELREQSFYGSISKIYYKPHRNGIRLTERYIADEFPTKEIIFLNSLKTSEELYFEEIRCKYISSFDSSTLINICSRIDESSRRKICFYVYPLFSNELIPLFKNLNFHFLKNK